MPATFVPGPCPRLGSLHRGETGQMAVELAIVLPIVFVFLVIAVDCLAFVGECARFDQLAPQKTLALAVSPPKDGYGADERLEAVRGALAAEFSEHGEQVRVESGGGGSGGFLSGAEVYEFELSMAPWPLGGPGTGPFGSDVPSLLRHRCKFAFDPYTPGEL